MDVAGTMGVTMTQFEEMVSTGTIGYAEKSNAFLFQFISPVNDAPPFEEISKQMLIPHWRKFRDMIETELGVK